MNPFVVIHSDRAAATIETIATNGGDPLFILSGSFKGSGDEQRICELFVTNGNGIAAVRLEFTDPAFVEHTVLGQQIYGQTEEDIDDFTQKDAV